jgi:WD40 repeat protein
LHYKHQFVKVKGYSHASGSDDRTLKVWDAASGQATITLTGHTGPVLSVAFSPDGKRIVSGSSDGTLTVWDASHNDENGHEPNPTARTTSADVAGRNRFLTL